jgi:hypothetical protein
MTSIIPNCLSIPKHFICLLSCLFFAILSHSFWNYEAFHCFMLIGMTTSRDASIETFSLRRFIMLLKLFILLPSYIRWFNYSYLHNHVAAFWGQSLSLFLSTYSKLFWFTLISLWIGIKIEFTLIGMRQICWGITSLTTYGLMIEQNTAWSLFFMNIAIAIIYDLSELLIDIQSLFDKYFFHSIFVLIHHELLLLLYHLECAVQSI